MSFFLKPVFKGTLLREIHMENQSENWNEGEGCSKAPRISSTTFTPSHSFLSSSVICLLLSIALLFHHLNKRLFKYAVPVLISFSPHRFSDLIQATQDTSVNVPQMADTLMERVGNASWVVVFKALITTHHLMVHGNEVSLKHAVYTHHDDTVCLASW